MGCSGGRLAVEPSAVELVEERSAFGAPPGVNRARYLGVSAGSAARGAEVVPRGPAPSAVEASPVPDRARRCGHGAEKLRRPAAMRKGEIRSAAELAVIWERRSARRAGARRRWVTPRPARFVGRRGSTSCTCRRPRRSARPSSASAVSSTRCLPTASIPRSNPCSRPSMCVAAGATLPPVSYGGGSGATGGPPTSPPPPGRDERWTLRPFGAGRRRSPRGVPAMLRIRAAPRRGGGRWTSNT